MEQRVTTFNLASAQAAARENQLATWVDQYLRTSVRPNVPFADGLQLERRWWAGPRLLPLDQLTRTCGSEPSMPYPPACQFGPGSTNRQAHCDTGRFSFLAANPWA